MELRRHPGTIPARSYGKRTERQSELSSKQHIRRDSPTSGSHNSFQRALNAYSKEAQAVHHTQIHAAKSREVRLSNLTYAQTYADVYSCVFTLIPQPLKP